MIEGVVVAAGLSSRAGGWKMAFDIGGLSVIERCVLGMSQYCSRIFVIGGDNIHLLHELLPESKYPAVELIWNHNYASGMYSSVLTGFDQVRAFEFFFIPGDYPLVSSRVYSKLLKHKGEIIIPSCQGVTGHPVLFRAKVIGDLLNEPGKYASLHEFIISRRHYIVEVGDPGIILDIDTMEDYRRAARYFEAGKQETTGFGFDR